MQVKFRAYVQKLSKLRTFKDNVGQFLKNRTVKVTQYVADTMLQELTSQGLTNKQRETERDRERQRETERDRDRDRDRDRETERQRDRERQRERGNMSQKQSPRGVRKIHRKTAVSKFLFNKVEGLHPATLLKKRPQHKCFPVNFAKF